MPLTGSEITAELLTNVSVALAVRRVLVIVQLMTSPMRGVTVLSRADGTLLALFESPYWLERMQADKPDLVLERIVAE